MFTVKTSSDSTALKRQRRRLERLKGEGIGRSTVFVHDDCKEALDLLRPYLLDKGRSPVLFELASELRLIAKPTNVAQVKHLSPFRYPGGKTWLVPEIRNWLVNADREVDVFVEPFAGGATAGLTAAAEGLAYSVSLSEVDSDVAAVWKTIFDGTREDIDWLKERILKFEVNLVNVRAALAEQPSSLREAAFRTIIKNRMHRGGIMATGAGLVKTGEAGRGLNSRWYPETLSTRIENLWQLRNLISFQQCDAFSLIQQFETNRNAFFFVDPPYTAGGKRAGSRLYEHSEVDHPRLFRIVAELAGPAMLTYDDSPQVRTLATMHGFSVRNIAMKNTHHAVMSELIILKS